MSKDSTITTGAVAVKALSRPELLREVYTLKSTMGCDARRAKRGSAKAYRYRLAELQSWQVYVGPVRNLEEARRALMAIFGEALREVRVHPLCDSFPALENNAASSLRRRSINHN